MHILCLCICTCIENKLVLRVSFEGTIRNLSIDDDDDLRNFRFEIIF